MANGTFKITYLAHLIFLLDRMTLANRVSNKRIEEPNFTFHLGILRYTIRDWVIVLMTELHRSLHLVCNICVLNLFSDECLGSSSTAPRFVTGEGGGGQRGLSVFSSPIQKEN